MSNLAPPKPPDRPQSAAPHSLWSALGQTLGLHRQAPPLEPAGRQQPLPLSFAQLRLWLIQQSDPTGIAYNLPFAWRLLGPLDVAALQRALQSIFQRHEIFRTTFATLEGEPVQSVAPMPELTLSIIDLNSLPCEQRQLELLRLLEHQARQPFDLARGPLLRAFLFRLAQAEHVLLLAMHHIVCDGSSLPVLFHELQRFYGGFSNRQPFTPPALPVQYADFALWQRRWLHDQVLAGQLAYWKQQLAGPLPVLELPADHPRPSAQSFQGGLHRFALPPELSVALHQFRHQTGATLFHLLLAAFKALLYRYTGQEDLIVGIPTANRQHPSLKPLIGFFVNTLVLRTRLDGALTFHQLLQRVQQTALQAAANQDVPFDRLVEFLRPDRTLSHAPLFQVLFSFQSVPRRGLELPGLQVHPLPIHNRTAKFDLTFECNETPHGLTGFIEYSTDLFDPPTIRRLANHWQTLLTAALAHPDLPLAALPMLTGPERDQILLTWNQTQREYPRDSSIPRLFESQAQRTPDAVAVTFEGRHLTYSQLNTRANQLAHYLRKNGVQPGLCVGVFLDRSLELIVALLAILKAGAAYLPLDRHYPKERLSFLLDDAQAPIVITTQPLQSQLPTANAKWICLDRDARHIARESPADPTLDLHGGSLAYVMYTSGSTGQPKGVCVPHRAVTRLVINTNYCRFAPDEVFLQFAPIAFDAATFEIWGPLLNGAKLVVFPPHLPSLAELGAFIQAQHITTLWLTAGLFHQMVEEQLDSLKDLRQLLAGGDVLSPAHVKKAVQALPGCQIINGYGPTENTTFTCCYHVPPGCPDTQPIPLGRPIANTQVYILDAHLQPVPIGVAGELHAGGDGLACGYWNRPDLTTQKFIPNPFIPDPSARLYKTGDLARFLPDGTLEFLGRLDHQVKIRGFRIELGEIEAVLARHPAVRQCVLVARPGPAGIKQLAAYVVPATPATLSIDELRHFLLQSLPDYMLPAAFVSLPALPLSPNGKIDRNALPAPQTKTAPADFIAPRDPLEQQLARLWEKIFRLPKVGIRDNFFGLGGHSLLAVRLFAQIEKLTGKNLPMVTLFQAPTIEQLADVLRRQGWEALWSSIVPIQPRGSKPPFFCVHGAGGNILEFFDLMKYMDPDQPFYGLQAVGLDGKRPWHKTVEEMAAHYVTEIRAFQPDGPYYLGGASFGGLVAFDIAQRLHAQGETVALLAFFDTFVPGFPKPLSNISRWQARWNYTTYRFALHWSNLQTARGAQRFTYLVVKTRKWLHSLPWSFRRRLFRLRQKIEFLRHPKAIRQTRKLGRRAHEIYVPKPYPGGATLFRAAEQMKGFIPDPANGWAQFIQGGLEIVHTPGHHGAIMRDPRAHVLAAQLSASLRKARQAQTAPERATPPLRSPA